MATVNSTNRHPNFKDLSGLSFGLWYVIGFHSNNKRGQTVWLCRCRCGIEKPVNGSNLTGGRSTQCRRCASTVHGEKDSPEWRAWGAMLTRCRSTSGEYFQYYGERGIKVCDRWLTFENFLADMGRKPSPQHSLDRYPDNDGNYEPSNCRWATAKEQSRNTRANRMVTYDGKTMCLMEWSEETGISHTTLYYRLYRYGWSAARALTTPAKGFRGHSSPHTSSAH